MARSLKPSTEKKYTKHYGIFSKNVITRKITIPFNSIGSNIKEILVTKLIHSLEGKCVNEGYIKKQSINVLSYSSGVIENNSVIFDVVLQALICKPVEGITIKCIVQNVTKAGIRATYGKDEAGSPVIVFIARDHNYKKPEFSNIKINDEIIIRVIGTRYELNDKYISIIAELVTKYSNKKVKKHKVRIVKNTE
jgi:DNA-directed RNA polymerase subunit E'/Rpb7